MGPPRIVDIDVRGYLFGNLTTRPPVLIAELRKRLSYKKKFLQLTRSARVDWTTFLDPDFRSRQVQSAPSETRPTTARASTSRKTPKARKKKRKTKRKKPSTVRRNTVLVEGANGEVTEETVVVKKCVYRRKKKKKAKKVKKV